MATLESIRERVESLYRDTSLTSVRAWKDARPGRRAVGYLPTYVPRELVHAAGMLPVGVVGHGDIEIIRGDAFFQSYICHLPRSVIELGVSKRLDVLDGMLFPSTCDVIRNLSGMWQLMFPDKYVRYVDVPQNFDPAVGGRFWRAELASLRDDLAKLAGVAISDEALRSSIRTMNANRRAVARLYEARREAPWLHPTAELYLVVRAGLLLPVEEHTALVDEYLAAARTRTAQKFDNIRVVVAGSFCEQPPIDLLKTLERAGCYIVDDDFLQIFRWHTEPVREDGDPLDALCDAFLRTSIPNASLYQADGNNGAALVEKVRASRADGVVFSAPSFCDPALLDQPMAVAALDRKGIPYTAFKYAENTGQFQVIREQAGTFADSIRLWGDA